MDVLMVAEGSYPNTRYMASHNVCPSQVWHALALQGIQS